MSAKIAQLKLKRQDYTIEKIECQNLYTKVLF